MLQKISDRFFAATRIIGALITTYNVVTWLPAILAGAMIVLSALGTWFFAFARIPALDSYGWGIYPLAGIAAAVSVCLMLSAAFLVWATGLYVLKRLTLQVSTSSAASNTFEPPQPSDFVIVSFESYKPSNKHDLVVSATVKMIDAAADVVVFGRWAKLTHYMNATPAFVWSNSKRIAEYKIAHEGEKFAHEIIRRTAQSADELRIFGDDVGVGTSSQVFQVEIAVAAVGKKPVPKKKAFQCWPENHRATTPIRLEDIPYQFEDRNA